MSDITTDAETLSEQKKTYARFMKLVKWSIIAAVILVLFLYVAINP